MGMPHCLELAGSVSEQYKQVGEPSSPQPVL